VLRAPVGTEAIDAVLARRDPGLRVRTCAPPRRETLLHQGRDLLCQACPGPGGDDAIVGKPPHMDFRPLTALEPRESVLDMSCQTVQGQGHQAWRCSTALGHAGCGRREDMRVHPTGGEPLAEDGLLHRAIGQEPCMRETGTAGVEVAFQEPWSGPSP
jgi:hypothetical protein